VPLRYGKTSSAAADLAAADFTGSIAVARQSAAARAIRKIVYRID